MPPEVSALQLESITLSFGALQVLNSVSLQVPAGTRSALVGPNGAGKTTLFNTISGELRPTGGRVKVFGADVTPLPPNARLHRGLARTFQRNNLFPGLTVFENVFLAVQGVQRRLNPWRPAWGATAATEATTGLLDRVGLTGRAGMVAGKLSYGEQRVVEISMALASKPRLLLLDEPTAGMSAAETESTIHLLQQLPADLTLLIVEHDMEVVSAVAERIFVLHFGELIAQGTTEEIRNNPQVAEIYLGNSEGEVAV